MICTVTPTIMDGYVVRWWRSVDHAEYGGPPSVSVSRNGIRVEVFLHEVPDDVLEQAHAAWLLLKARATTATDYDTVQAMATHRFSGPFKNGDVVPIEREATDA
jgi:hypothetical protein